jgi:hypothetical protein
VGYAKAKELVLTGRMIPAAEALRIGLVAEVVPDGTHVEAGVRLATEIAGNAPLAVGLAKRLVDLWRLHRQAHVPGDGAFAQRHRPDRGRARGRPRPRRAPATAVHRPVTERARPEVPTWNVLATSIEGQREALLAALRRLARFRRGGFPNVLVATVEDSAAFLDALAEARAASPLIQASLGKVIPIEQNVPARRPHPLRRRRGRRAARVARSPRRPHLLRPRLPARPP